MLKLLRRTAAVLILVAVGTAGWMYWEARLPWPPLPQGRVAALLGSSGNDSRTLAALERLKTLPADLRPAVEALTVHPNFLIRAEAARLLPQNESMLVDASPYVRMRAAVVLGEAGSPAARAFLIASLYPQTVFSPVTGALRLSTPESRRVAAGSRIATVGGSEILAPIPGLVDRIYASGKVDAGERILDIVPAPELEVQVLHALGKTGTPAELDVLPRMERTAGDAGVRAQAAEARREIEARSPHRGAS